MLPMPRAANLWAARVGSPGKVPGFFLHYFSVCAVILCNAPSIAKAMDVSSD